MENKINKWFILQTLLLLSGTLFAWYNTIKNFVRFYGYEGTIFKIQDCVIPNPVTESCFYGAIGFLVALIWSLYIYQRRNTLNFKIQHYLWWFLSAGTIFALYNVAKEFTAFYSAKDGPVLGCSSTVITNPFLTPCFTGALIFLLSAVTAGYIYSKLSKQNTFR